jgi:two-component system, chemotaxis family, sensor kinase Cph1
MNHRLPLPDLSLCEAEPIRLPGAIQPHGRIVVLNSADATLLAYSSNWRDVEEISACLTALRFDTAKLALTEGASAVGFAMIGGTLFHATAHRTRELVLIEFESSPSDEPGTEAPIYSLARHFLPQLEHAGSVVALAEMAAAEIKRLTGFGRCLVYRFDEEGHGEVLAERVDEGYDAYQGHRFPASDIPAQARELYRINHIRLIPNVAYEPVPLRCVDPARDPRSIDLSGAFLRSVSPVHLEYMRNMGTMASMSISIVVRGRLWGLISCHNHAPRTLSFQTRVACEHMGRLLSLQIEAKETHADVVARLELRQLTLEIVSRLADTDATLQRLTAEPALLLRLARATGAAVVLDDHVWSVGDVPSEAQVQAVAAWVAGMGCDVYESHQLAGQFPSAADFEHVAAGVLAISISQVHRHLILWFRAETIHTIQWAGNPHSKLLLSDGRIHPRKSFESWRENVRGRSTPWSTSEVGAARDLRQALIGIVLRRAEEMAAVATELGRVNKELEAFSYTVSHDLRAPMRHIAGYVDLVLDMEGKQLTERAHRYLGNVKDAAAFAGQLVDALLDFSRMGRSALQCRPVDTAQLVHSLVQEISRQEVDRAIDWHIDAELPTLHADALLLQVAVRNLLTNAAKYTRTQDRARIEVRKVERPEGEGLEVVDNGVGFQMKYVGKLFGVFQRLHQAEDFEGTGIGLASVKRIVERHGGLVWAQGEINEGAVFGFVLPRLAASLPTQPAPDTHHHA